MSGIGTALTVAEAIKLTFSLLMWIGKSSGMSEEELKKLRETTMEEFDKTDPEGVIKMLEENMK